MPQRTGKSSGVFGQSDHQWHGDHTSIQGEILIQFLSRSKNNHNSLDAQLKTKRQRNAEHLLRLGAKWEKERQAFEMAERVREAAERERQERAYALEERYIENTGQRKMELLTYVYMPPRSKHQNDEYEINLNGHTYFF